MSKKSIAVFLLAAALCMSSMIGCSSSSQGNDTQATYYVVEMEKGTAVEDCFEFTSVSGIVLNVTTKTSNTDEDIYAIGHLENGDTVIWRSSDDHTGYDDCLFLYVEDEIDSTSIAVWSAKLNEDPISYEEFEKK